MTPVGRAPWIRANAASRRPPAATGFGLAGVVAVLGYFAIPVVGPGPLDDPDQAQGVVFTAVSAAAAVSIVVGVALRRPARPLPWLTLATGQALFAIGDGLDVYVFQFAADGEFPTSADLAYLMGYPLIVLALVIFVRRRTPGWQLATMIDATVIAIGVGLLGWVYVIEPIATAPDVTLLARVVSVAYPVMDLFVLVVSVRLILGTGARPVAFHLLLASSASMLLADVLYAVGTEAGSWRDGTWVDGAWLVEYTLLGCAALHPSMRRLDEKTAVAPPAATPARLGALAIASLTGPAVLLIQHVRYAPLHVVVVALACAALSLLVLARMAELVAVHRRAAITDSLTGLRSRGYFQEALRVEGERAVRGDDPMGVLLIDADHFKRINDTYGHPIGDRVLRELAKRLKESCRPGDVVARYGGEEFAVLLASAHPALVEQAAERIRQAIAREPLPLGDGLLVQMTISVGAAALPDNGTTGDEVIRLADRALYAAKHAGRNRVVAAWQSTLAVR